MQSDFRSVVAARERRRQCRDGLQGMVSFASFVREGRHRGLQFPEDIHKVAVARKREMTRPGTGRERGAKRDRKSTRLNSSHGYISYAVFCLKKKNDHMIDSALVARLGD